MQEVFEKIIEKLEERTSFLSDCTKYGNKDAKQQNKSYSAMMMYEVADLVDDLIDIVKHEAEQYEECYKHCGECEAYDKEKHHCPKFCKVIKETVKEIEENHNGWIPVDEELPKDGDNRYYMCIVENHEEDPPMHCQYDEECGFGFYQDIYDEHTLGFVDCVFHTNDELGYEKVIAWQPLPQPYQPKGE